MTEEDAFLAVAAAHSTLSKALDDLRAARGESADEPCTFCPPGPARPDSDCPYCKGTGFRKKKYPWIVTGVEWDNRPVTASLRRNATWVSVRPCAEEFGNKTYLGWLIGDIALSQGVSLKPDGTLNVFMTRHNPAILVPELKRVIFGMESWWSPIENPEDLRKISTDDIENVWYVMALRDLEAAHV